MSSPNKICRISRIDGQYIREDGAPVDICRLYIRQDEGEAWMYDGPFPDSMVSPEPPPDA
jgi:hypothetical protein